MSGVMKDTWAHQWMNKSRTMIMFHNRHVSSNIIYSIEELRRIVEGSATKTFRQVPLHVMKAALAGARFDIGLRQRFMRAISA